MNEFLLPESGYLAGCSKDGIVVVINEEMNALQSQTSQLDGLTYLPLQALELN